jgi:hypothetical protein
VLVYVQHALNPRFFSVKMSIYDKCVPGGKDPVRIDPSASASWRKGPENDPFAHAKTKPPLVSRWIPVVFQGKELVRMKSPNRRVLIHGPTQPTQTQGKQTKPAKDPNPNATSPHTQV